MLKKISYDLGSPSRKCLLWYFFGFLFISQIRQDWLYCWVLFVHKRMLSPLKQISVSAANIDSHWRTELLLVTENVISYWWREPSYIPFPSQVTSHNKERRSKRDEKLDKKSQAMEELKAEREKRKNRTGKWGKCNGYFVSLIIWFDFPMPFLSPRSPF